MRGITEERLKKLIDIVQDPVYKLHLNDLIDNDCTELNPWHPIETPPQEHKRVLVYFPDGQCEVARLVDGGWTSNDGLDYGYGADIPTHWQELPEDPK